MSSRETAALKRKLFVEAYLSNGMSGPDAALAAGYKGTRTALRVTASRVLDHPSVKAEIEKRQSQLAKKAELGTQSVIAELAGIVHFDPAELFDDDGNLKPIRSLPLAVRKVIASIEVEVKPRLGVKVVKIKLNDKNSALEKAMKYLGLFKKDNEQPAEAAAALLSGDRKELARRAAFLLARGLRG